MPESARPLPRHVTTPLLTLITEQSLDGDYAHVAAARAARPSPPGRTRLGIVGGVLVTAFGAMATVAVMQNNREADDRELSREALIRQIDAKRDQVGRLQQEVQALAAGAQSADEAVQSLQQQLQTVSARVRRLEIRTGYIPVHGPGVRIEVASAPNADPNDEVRDEDLALLVNGLFQAGAEAVAINEQRVVALGGIRNTNRAVHVNGRPLTAPYTVSAIGDVDALQSRLVETTAGLMFLSRANDLQFSYDARDVQDLRLPAASVRTLRQARLADGAGDPSEKEAEQ